MSITILSITITTILSITTTTILSIITTTILSIMSILSITILPTMFDYLSVCPFLFDYHIQLVHNSTSMITMSIFSISICNLIESLP